MSHFLLYMRDRQILVSGWRRLLCEALLQRLSYLEIHIWDDRRAYRTGVQWLWSRSERTALLIRVLLIKVSMIFVTASHQRVSDTRSMIIVGI